MSHWSVNGMKESNKRCRHSRTATAYKTYVVGHDDERPLLFTPSRYDASTGLLYGVNQSERPMVLPLARLLMPYEEHGLDWSDESDSDTPDL